MTRGRELMDAVAATVRHIDVPVPVHRDTTYIDGLSMRRLS
jgi:hypothetical protein